MAGSIPNGALSEKFNQVGRFENISRTETETETEDAGSFRHHRPGQLVGGIEPISKFTIMAVAIVPPEPAARARKPLDVRAPGR